ncbi:hypothetical protein D3C72_2157230 [compost metagenome]
MMSGLLHAAQVSIGGDQHPVGGVEVRVDGQGVAGPRQSALAVAANDIDHGQAAQGETGVRVERRDVEHMQQPALGLSEVAAM